ncbi:dipeptidase [Candidatus Viadribacter manganicus]|uniref:Membrane dipeptidase n=1 Tax=Candidatus Viadribacter manganicus TaxID=1759059 RepID=A0A1B1AJM8_9PROT|nr:dipeptidase [Candidatus Viadribacter manganicus]ANP46757.1 membrane dipeptidase [Candidatus Viadribacter manganicus]
MHLRFAVLGAIALSLATPAWGQSVAPTPREQNRIERILSRTPLIDGHNDLPDQVKDNFGGDITRLDLTQDTSRLTPSLHTDIPRLRHGHIGAQFWSVYVPAELQGAQAAEAVEVQIDVVRQLIARYPTVFAFAESADDIVRIHRRGQIASMIGMEGGEPINSNLAVLRSFRAQGVLYMTLCHAKTTAWVDSATDAPRHGGLSPFGEEVVREMNRIGMLVDLSHVSADAMRDALQVASAPVIFSHSSAYALTAHPRNVPDDVLQLVHQNGGVVMVNFYPGFVSEEVRAWSAQRAGEEARQKALHPNDPDAVRAAMTQWEAATPRPLASVAEVADHIEHIRDVAGVENVGIGADMDGVPFLPAGLDGVDGYPNLFAELMRRGWSDADLARLAGGNLLRVLRRAEAVAASSAG